MGSMLLVCACHPVTSGRDLPEPRFPVVQRGDGPALSVITPSKCFVSHWWALLHKNIKYLVSFIKKLKDFY